MGVGVGEMTRGVPGVWYFCDILRKDLKEWNGGKAARVESPKSRSVRSCIVKVEWGGVAI